MVEYQDELNEFANDIRDVMEKYKESVPGCEIAFRLIAEGVITSLCRAPNELVGVKTIMASVQNGISEYEKTHS